MHIPLLPGQKIAMDADALAPSSGDPTGIDLMVSEQEFEAVPGMSELIESIKTYVTPKNPSNSAKHVAIIFAAVLTAIRSTGIQVGRPGVRPQRAAEHRQLLHRGARRPAHRLAQALAHVLRPLQQAGRG